MWQLLARCCTLLPPNQANIEFTPNQEYSVKGITYGADLIFGRIGNEYDQTLRTAILWCMSKYLLLTFDARSSEIVPWPSDQILISHMSCAFGCDLEKPHWSIVLYKT